MTFVNTLVPTFDTKDTTKLLFIDTYNMTLVGKTGMYYGRLEPISMDDYRPYRTIGYVHMASLMIRSPLMIRSGNILKLISLILGNQFEKIIESCNKHSSMQRTVHLCCWMIHRSIQEILVTTGGLYGWILYSWVYEWWMGS